LSEFINFSDGLLRESNLLEWHRLFLWNGGI